MRCAIRTCIVPAILALAGLTLGQSAAAQNNQQQNETQQDESSGDREQQSDQSASFELGDTGMTLKETDEGIQVTEVRAGTPADRARLETGDILKSINGEQFDSLRQLKNRASNMTQRDALKIQVDAQDGKTYTETLQLDSSGEQDRGDRDVSRDRQLIESLADRRSRSQQRDQADRQARNRDQARPQRAGRRQQDRDDRAQRDQYTCDVCGLTVRPAEQSEGLRVANVQPNSPAQDADVQEGDVVLKVDGSEVTTPRQLTRLMTNSQGNVSESDVQLQLRRDQRKRQVTLTLDPAREQRMSPRQLDRDQRRGRMARREGRQTDDTYGGLGIRMPYASRGEGVEINGVFRGSPAAQAGLRVGDRIVRIGDERVSTPGQVIAAIASMDPDERAVLTIRRDGEPREIDVELGTRARVLQRQDRMNRIARREQLREAGERRRFDGGRQGDAAGEGSRLIRLREELSELRQTVRDLRQRVRNMTGDEEAGSRSQRPGRFEESGRFDESRTFQESGGYEESGRYNDRNRRSDENRSERRRRGNDREDRNRSNL